MTVIEQDGHLTAGAWAACVFCYLLLLQTYTSVLVMDRISSCCQTNMSRREFCQINALFVNKTLQVRFSFCTD